MESESGEYLDGVSLVEVFNIVYLGDDQVPPEKQLGTISFVPPNRTDMQYLYKVDDVDLDKPSLKYGDPIMVTVGPQITEFCEFDFEFNLFCGAYTGIIEVEWEKLPYDGVELWEERIDSDDGTGQICVQYGLFANAAVANVELTLLGNCDSTNVHGSVFASNSRLDLPTRASILFWVNSDNKVHVRDGMIPLSRSQVGVPLDSEFDLSISLFCDSEECTTKVSLIPGEPDTFLQNFCEDKLQVRVTWELKKESITS
ncbi:hypothetical protein POM88_006291 [Heracleum sosnowskyi]|uniref:DUF6598 domain-containing protein n=1 Tax=Heracleum sosnowskyi TaxID=360622 RepID=A0AAD8J3H3_9APIA|nr:hypothetical protein POM88_006291 [Heracleum sosnowskyi]